MRWHDDVDYGKVGIYALAGLTLAIIGFGVYGIVEILNAV